MLHEEYRDMVRFLMEKDGQIMPLTVATLGLVGELAEFEAAQTVDELGDVVWYLTALRILIPISGRPKGLSDVNPVGLLCELVKKHAWHGKELNGWHAHYLLDLIEGALGSPIRIEGAMRANMKKLRARYPNGFVEGGGIR